MDESKLTFKIEKIWKYVVFLFAFICCGFVFHSSKVTAAGPIISIPDNGISRDSTGKATSLTFYVGYGSVVVKSVDIKLDDNWTKTISGSPTSGNVGDVQIDVYGSSSSAAICSSAGITCTDNIAKYTIKNIGSKVSVSASDNYFDLEVNSSNRKWPLGGDSSKSKENIKYDDKAPVVSSVSVKKKGTSSGGLLKIGDEIEFVVSLNELSNISSGANISFSLNGSTKTASCSAKSSATAFYCYYKIVAGDGGNSDSNRKISNVKLTEANNVKDIYGNAMSSTITGFTFSDSYSVRIDGVNPGISNIEASKGIYSSSSKIQVQVTFNEDLKGTNVVAPTMTVKVSDGANITCSAGEVTGKKTILYLCSPGVNDQGTLEFVRLSGGSGLKDDAGNSLNLSYSSKEFEGVEVNNNIPSVDSVNVDLKNCDFNKVQYCNEGDQITISFKFNMKVTVDSKVIVIKFGSVNGKNVYTSSYDETTKTLAVVYNINKQDNGDLNIEYSFSLTGDNGKKNNISKTEDEYEIYADNTVPTVKSVEPYIDGAKVEGTTIYSRPGVVVEFRAIINENSVVNLNDTYIWLVDQNNNRLTIDSVGNYGITKLSSTLKDKLLTVEVTITGECQIGFKVKIGKNAITDAFGETLENDYYSTMYTVDTKLPEFNVELIYPQYKAYNSNGKWVLTGGNSIEFKLASNDKDLKDYCIVVDSNAGCESYSELKLGTNNKYSFENVGDGDYLFYVRVRDKALNKKDVPISFVFDNIYTYSNGEGSTAKNHYIIIDISRFNSGDQLKYAWFQKNANVSFESSTPVIKEADTLMVNGDNFNGEYMACVNNVTANVVLCSEYVKFDTRIDYFEVEIDNEWISGNLATNVIFSDASFIKCIAIGKNISNVNCDRTNISNIVIYRTYQAVSPFRQYTITENGIYYFYIEDIVGNNKIISKTVTNIDKESIKIEVFNGEIGDYNTNLEIDSYKKSHSFLITFDKDVSVGSAHNSYKYFFSRSIYTNVNSKDTYNVYYLKSSHRGEVTNCTKSMKVVTPSEDGIYNLYIMALDAAGNVSLETIKDIRVDATGPSIKMYDLMGEETNGGSATYIAVFEYNFSIEDYDSKLNLNRIVYKWLNNSGDAILEKNYESCDFGSNTCIISGTEIEFGGIFDPNAKYKFSLTAYDNAGNSSTFISNEFMIDTVSPQIVIDVNEDAWYENGNISFTVTKANIGTLNTIAYCLNDCYTFDNSYSLSKFRILTISGGTRVEKNVNLTLINGVNKLVVYANDVFGNYTYKEANIKHDKENASIVVKGLNANGVIDLNGIKDESNLKFDFLVRDEISGIKEYCVYYTNDISSKMCYTLNGDKEVSSVYNVIKNGLYSIEATDVVGNKNIYNVSVVGIDTEPIEFDLVSNVKTGQYVNGNVMINIVNMRKYMVDEASERVATIDYVKLNANSIITSYEEIFRDNSVISIYDKNSSASLVTSFKTDVNSLFVVRIVDTGGNISYGYILVDYIDVVKPILDVEGIYVSINGNGKLYNDVTNNIYRYSSNFLNIDLTLGSLMDNNDYLGLKVCFEEKDICNYNTYNISNYKNGNYYINNSISVTAPYKFSGVIKYYLVDGAGNKDSEEVHILNVNYQSDVSKITIDLKDTNGEIINQNNKYSSVNVTLSGDEVEDIITSNLSGVGISYALVKSNINLHNLVANGGSLNSYGFIQASDVSFNVSKSGDDTYYLWVYVSDLLGNFDLIKSDLVIRIDTIAPRFDEINFSVEKSGVSEYTLILNDFVDGYKLFVDSDNNGVYEELSFFNQKATFVVSGVDTVSFKLVDEAGNTSYLKNVDVTSMSGDPFAKVYQETNERVATIVIYNLGNRRVTSFRYIATDVNSTVEYDESSIAQIIYSCNESNYSETCKGELTSNANVYSLDLSNLNADKRVIFYIYIDGSLINLVEKKIIEDKVAPHITISGTKDIITTVSDKVYTYDVSVEEINMSSLTSKKYILSKNVVYSYNFESAYQSCVNSNSCARGTFDLNDSLEGTIEIGSNFNKLSSGNYNLYIYMEDDFGNARLVSSSTYVDNTLPTISYSTANNPNYSEIIGTVYVGGAVTLRIMDNKQVSYFEIYNSGSDTPSNICSIDGSKSNVNCNNLVNEMYYNLDTGNYLIKVYDMIGNVKEVSISIDGSDPIIEIYRKVESRYELQNVSGKLYNDLTNLYVLVEEANFSYLTIDLINTITGNEVNTASRYSYNSDIGICLVDRTSCEHGVSLVTMLVGNTSQYNKIRINVFDNANRSKSVEVNYDDNVPEIWMVDDGEIIYIGGVSYTVEENRTINVEIGVNPQLTLDSLLNRVILSIDGMSYNGIKNSELFKVVVYKDGKVFENDLCSYIGNYTISVSYVDIAGNKAPSKEINVNVIDNTEAKLTIIDDINNVEIKEEITISGVLAVDNYGLIVGDYGELIKEKVILLSSATCEAVINNISGACNSEVIKESDSTYRFMKSGKYTFTYSVEDLAGNISSIVQIINVSDTKGPQMSSSAADGQVTFERQFGNRIAGAINISNVVLGYPNSIDVGDGENKSVIYEGLYALNSMGEKYKVNDVYLIANENNSVTYSFTKVGTYYLRFSSKDNSNNISIFDYEVIVSDKIAPVIEGVLDEQVIKLELEETFSVEYLIQKYGIKAIDNYDSNVKIYYELIKSEIHSHEVLLKASDTSNNSIEITLFVDIEDHVAPFVGELMLDTSTNQKNLEMLILGGSDNSNNWWHEYSVLGGAWIRIDEDTKLKFNEGLSEYVQVCIRAVDAASNISETQSCKTILVDTKLPDVKGVKDGDILNNSIEVSVSDDRLSSVNVWFNNESLDLSIANMPFIFENVGAYQIIAKDAVGNETIVSFMINSDTHMDIVNDINSEEYTINSIEFDDRFLVRVDISYDSNGYSNIYTKLDGIKVKANDMVYILGIIPNTDNAFVIFSSNGVNIGNYANGINLIGGGSYFKEGINNEECFVKFNDYYYAYVLVKENASKDPVAVVDDKGQNSDNSKLLGGLFIALGTLAIVFVGYQFIKFKKRVKAA